MTGPAENTQPAEDRTEFIKAATAAAFTTEEGDQIIHSFAGGFLGADWDLAGVPDAIERARQVAFGPDILGHHLRVITHDGRLLRFEVPMPSSSGVHGRTEQ